jgi:hypothetical protein
MRSPKINVSFLAAGIFAQVFYIGIDSGHNDFKSGIISEELVSCLKF